ncbi:MAG: ABC transporter ATP-binding protein/permease [Oscillospiraceae bacterium]|jgi:ATP-binding cassette subfamily B protein|nr:ABC transporter ATP-binding protein/permease [Oscillospiraceae bacterium]
MSAAATRASEAGSPQGWGILKPHIGKLKKHIAIVITAMLVSSVAEAAYPLFTRYAVREFIEKETTEGIAAYVMVCAAVIIAGGAASVLWTLHSITVEMRVGPALKRDCFARLQTLPVQYYASNSVGYLLARVMSDTDRISGSIAWGVSGMLFSVCYVAGAIAFMFALDARLALLLMALLPVAAGVVWLFQRKIIVVNRRIRHVNSRISGAYNDSITGVKTSKSLVIEDKNSAEFEEITAEMYRESVRLATLRAMLIPLVSFLGSLAVGAVLYRGGVLQRDGLLGFEVLSAFISYAVGIIEPIMQLTRMITDFVSVKACVERVSALLNEPLTISDTPEVTEKYGGIFDPRRDNWEPVEGRVTFENVYFRYPGGDRYVLEDFSLDIPAGTTVAIVGETGAGKSTIVNLACRFYEPERGRVLIDGRNCRERSQLWLRSSLGCVLQDPHLFSGTIADNIRYGKLDATDREVERAARLASADAVAARLENGYGTQVGEGGDMLSTGEKQLVSLARAVLADPAIFVLDEATSSIDAETEALIQNAISNILRGRTSIVIAHRLSTIRRADVILVVDKGKIVERGTHAELMELGGRYGRLYTSILLK